MREACGHEFYVVGDHQLFTDCVAIYPFLQERLVVPGARVGHLHEGFAQGDPPRARSRRSPEPHAGVALRGRKWRHHHEGPVHAHREQRGGLRAMLRGDVRDGVCAQEEALNLLFLGDTNRAIRYDAGLRVSATRDVPRYVCSQRNGHEHPVVALALHVLHNN